MPRGHNAAGVVVSYVGKTVPQGAEVGFGMTINIINGGLESNTNAILGSTGRRVGFFARYLDYFGTVKNGRDDGQTAPISPQVGGRGGDPVPQSVIDVFKNWRNWIFFPPADVDPSTDPAKIFPRDKITSVIGSQYSGSFF